MQKIKVLVIDDAVVVRKIILDALAIDPQIEVVGTAPNGRIGLQKIALLKPDVVTMDIEMPEMDGLQALTELRKTNTKIPVIMFSTLTERGGQATLEALARGATDYVTKPANVGSVTEGINRCRDELIPKIKWLAGPRLGGGAAALAKLLDNKPPVIPPPRPRFATEPHVLAIAIGISTGGPVALGKLLPLLPADLGVPVLVVQHMPPVFTRLLAERLNSNCALTVVEGKAGMKVEPNTVYIAPGAFHMTVRKNHDGSCVLDTNTEPMENSCRPAVDVLFRSAAKTYGSGLLTAVLTGMGYDGTKGAEVVRAAGGYVIAQDEASSVVWGMPGSVVHAGLADDVIPLDRVAQTLTRRAKAGKGHDHPEESRLSA